MYQLKEKEMIFVFTGPDGAGRRTLAHMVSSTFGMKEVISYTTRPRRPIEVTDRIIILSAKRSSGRLRKRENLSNAWRSTDTITELKTKTWSG